MHCPSLCTDHNRSTGVALWLPRCARSSAARGIPGHFAGGRLMLQLMQIFTSLVLAAFGGYIGAWYFGAIEGNFALLLFLATVVTGAYWLAERFYFLPQRRRAAQAVED